MTSKQIRIVIGSVLLAVVAGLFALDAWMKQRVFGSAVATILGLAGFLEFARMTGAVGSGFEGADSKRPVLALVVAAFAGTAWFLGLAWYEGVYGALPAEWTAGGIVASVFCLFLAVLFRRDHAAAFEGLPTLFLGVVLFGLLYSYLLRIYHHENGTLVGAVFLLGVKGTDIVAYLVGSAIGRHRFLHVSPKKSVEGSVAALVFGALWFAGAGAIWPQVFFPWWSGLAIGLLMAVTAALGDLAESLLKRHYQVKDSGSLLPEFGGVLDIIDSFLFSGFVFWMVLAFSR